MESRNNKNNIYSLDSMRKNKNTITTTNDMKSYFQILSMSELLGENQKLIDEIQVSFNFTSELKMKSKLILDELKNRFSGSPFQIQKKFHKISKQHESLINRI